MSKSTLLAPAAVATTVPITFLASSGQGIRQLIPKLKLASDIKNNGKYKEIECLKNYFGEITFNATQNSKPTSNDISDFSSDSKSCLIIEYHKKTYSDNEWQGEFRFIWAVKDNNQGLITVTSARTVEGNLKGSSAAYSLKKHGTNNSWTTSHKYEVGERTKDEKTGLKNLIPQASPSLPGAPDATKYWGWDPDLKKICKKGNCTENENQTVRNSYSWELIKNEQGSEASSWTSNINDWLTKIFDWGVLVNKTNQVKGEWRKNP